MNSVKLNFLGVSDDDCVYLQACRANEICESFEGCVCEKNCYEVALRNSDQKEKQSIGKNETDLSQWLRRSSRPRVSPVPRKRQQIFPANLTEPEMSLWLRQNPAVDHKVKDTANQQLKNQTNACVSRLSTEPSR